MLKCAASALLLSAFAAAHSMPDVHVSVRAQLADTPLIACNSKGTNTTFLSDDEIEYFATIVGTQGLGFTVALNVTAFDTSPSCDPQVFVQFAGDGPGGHPYHQFQIGDGVQIVMPIKDATAKNVDWMFQSEITCDYAVTFDWTVKC